MTDDTIDEDESSMFNGSVIYDVEVDNSEGIVLFEATEDSHSHSLPFVQIDLFDHN